MEYDVSTQSDALGHHRVLITFLVAALSMLAPFSIDTYLPSFPAISAELGATHVQMQQTMSLYLLTFAVTTLLHGPLSDAFGRRKVIIGSLLLYVVCSIGAALSGSIAALILWRAGQGFSASAGVVVGRAMVRDAFQGHRAQQVMSQVMLIFAVAPAIAPIIGGVLEQAIGWRSVFWCLTLLGVVLMLLVSWRAPETLPVEARHSIHPNKVLHGYVTALRSSRFMGLVIAVALNFGGFFLYIAAAPSVLYDHLHLGPGDFWMQFVPMVAGLMCGSFLSGRSAGHITPRTGILIGYGAMFTAGLLNVAQALWLPPAPWNVLGPLVLYAFAVAFSMPSLSLLALDCFPRQRGMASAVQSFLQMIFNALVAGMIVPLLVHQLWALAVGMLLLSLAGFTVWALQEWRYDCEAP